MIPVWIANAFGSVRIVTGRRKRLVIGCCHPNFYGQSSLGAVILFACFKCLERPPPSSLSSPQII
jgi:hypothetical protein